MGYIKFERFLPWRNLWWWPTWKVPSFVILHSVGEDVVDPCCPNNTLRPDELRNFIKAMRQAGYVFKTFADAVASGDARTVSLTFDDGFIDNYTALFPILNELTCPATCFVTNRGNPDFPRERWSTEDPIPPNAHYLTAAMIREMDASGLVEIGGHTAGHTTLTKVSLESAEREIIDNKKWLESVLGHKIVSFAYPRGGENERIVSLLTAAGYKYAAAMKKKMRPVETEYYRIHRQIIPRGLETWKSVLLATRGKWKI
jgi:peptidoglycan/xylan/chitin deacetylase (PgdA/CDA1 family)